MVPAVKHSITPIPRTDTLVPTGTGKLIGGTGKLLKAIKAVLVSITHIGVVDAAVVRTQEVGRRACIRLISLIYAINNSITAVGVGPATSFVTLKGVVATVVVRWRNRIVLDAVPLIGLKFHAVWTATHSTVGGSRETEVAASPVGHHIAAADKACGPVVVENGFLVAIKLHSRARERRPEPCEGQGDVLLEGYVQWDSPHTQRGGQQQVVLHLCSKNYVAVPVICHPYSITFALGRHQSSDKASVYISHHHITSVGTAIIGHSETIRAVARTSLRRRVAMELATQGRALRQACECILTEFLPTGIKFCRLVFGVISRLVLLSQLVVVVARGILGTPPLAKADRPLACLLTEVAWLLAKLLLTNGAGVVVAVVVVGVVDGPSGSAVAVGVGSRSRLVFGVISRLVPLFQLVVVARGILGTPALAKSFRPLACLLTEVAWLLIKLPLTNGLLAGGWL
ncbi:hypothetical protein FQN60_003152, partial [Etheostoma spectabile]